MRPSLQEIGLKYGTDKAWYHRYCDRYATYLEPYRDLDGLRFLEIGWGGDGGTLSDTAHGGQSARMWKEYAPGWDIHVIDIIDKSEENDAGVTFHQGDQADQPFLDEISGEHGWDFIVDDGSHVAFLTYQSINYLWDHLRPGGWYFIEDLTTAYQPAYGGSPSPRAQENTHLGFLMSLVNDVMLGCPDTPRFQPLLGNVLQLQFSPNMVAIQKAWTQ